MKRDRYNDSRENMLQSESGSKLQFQQYKDNNDDIKKLESNLGSELDSSADKKTFITK